VNWGDLLYTVLCMMAGAALLVLVQLTTRARRSKPSEEDKKRAQRAIREINARDVRRMK
jgi:hypothetical protein